MLQGRGPVGGAALGSGAASRREALKPAQQHPAGQQHRKNNNDALETVHCPRIQHSCYVHVTVADLSADTHRKCQDLQGDKMQLWRVVRRQHNPPQWRQGRRGGCGWRQAGNGWLADANFYESRRSAGLGPPLTQSALISPPYPLGLHQLMNCWLPDQPRATLQRTHS